MPLPVGAERHTGTPREVLYRVADRIEGSNSQHDNQRIGLMIAYAILDVADAIRERSVS